MTDRSAGRGSSAAYALHWVARLSATAIVVLLLMMLFGESGSGPGGWREWAYLALFPVGFSAGYLLGWRWPLLGGSIAVACMILSLVVIGRVFEPHAYGIWAILTVPGILYLIVGSRRSAVAPGGPR